MKRDRANDVPPRPAVAAAAAQLEVFVRVSELQQRVGDGPDTPVWFGLSLQASDPHVVAYFTVDGEPASKARARWGGGKGKPYTPKSTKEAENKIGWLFRQAVGPFIPNSTDAFGVFAAFHCATRQRRDVDNMIKLVLDALNGIAWVDDMQVSEVAGRVARGTADARTEVLIYRTLANPAPTRPCKNCGQHFPHYPSQAAQQFCAAKCGYEYRRKQNQRTCEHCSRQFQKQSGPAKYCSRACASAARSVTLSCEQCGKGFTKARSLATQVKPMCSTECRAAYWRVHRQKAAQGVCASCQGPTSKKSYTRCNACRLSGTTTKAVS